MGRIVGVFHEVADDLFGVVSRAAGGLEHERDEVDVWKSVKFGLFSSLSHVTWAGAGCCNEGRVAARRRDNSIIEVCGRTIVNKNNIHNTSEGWGRLFDVHLVPLCECITSARHPATAACLRSTPLPYRQP